MTTLDTKPSASALRPLSPPLGVAGGPYVAVSMAGWLAARRVPVNHALVGGTAPRRPGPAETTPPRRRHGGVTARGSAPPPALPSRPPPPPSPCAPRWPAPARRRGQRPR